MVYSLLIKYVPMAACYLFDRKTNRQTKVKQKTCVSKV